MASLADYAFQFRQPALILPASVTSVEGRTGDTGVRVWSAAAGGTFVEAKHIYIYDEIFPKIKHF